MNGNNIFSGGEQRHFVNERPIASVADSARLTFIEVPSRDPRFGLSQDGVG